MSRRALTPAEVGAIVAIVLLVVFCCCGYGVLSTFVTPPAPVPVTVPSPSGF